MKSSKLNQMFALGALAAVLAGPVAAESQHFGNSVQAASAERTINLSSGKKYINVEQGEVVQFVKDGRTFTWRFDTLGTPVFDLSEIAPAGFVGRGIKVYVSPDPITLSG